MGGRHKRLMDRASSCPLPLLMVAIAGLGRQGWVGGGGGEGREERAEESLVPPCTIALQLLMEFGVLLNQEKFAAAAGKNTLIEPCFEFCFVVFYFVLFLFGGSFIFKGR